MSLEFMTMLSKLDCALPTLYPEHSNARGDLIRAMVMVMAMVMAMVR